ncbi:hypothetical protein, partial [Serratia marcescens]|uniref:hypothetical protein n=1 Tax=Serratia marcescens TaxID=615 RepID=UPI0028148BD3
QRLKRMFAEVEWKLQLVDEMGGACPEFSFQFQRKEFSKIFWLSTENFAEPSSPDPAQVEEGSKQKSEADVGDTSRKGKSILQADSTVPSKKSLSVPLVSVNADDHEVNSQMEAANVIKTTSVAKSTAAADDTGVPNLSTGKELEQDQEQEQQKFNDEQEQEQEQEQFN